jgi:peptide/nickel transport system ATP-binding protein
MLLQVEDLYCNFYTYQGVVKALDGVTFNIKKGETFGLVGETGCGKSVTANCVLRLIPSPPGKIESGRILFFMPPDVMAKKDELTAKIAQLSQGNGADAQELASLKKDLAKIYGDYDLLQKSLPYMRKIRGKYISMIFQEPMSALNPVFPAGDQISEILLLHERKELAQAVLKKADLRIKEINSYFRVTRKRTAKGEWECEKCKAVMAEELDTCPQCGGSFVGEPFRGLERARIKFNMRYYRTMAKTPDAFSLRLVSKIPILRRYERFIKEEGMDRAERMLRLVRIPDPQNVVRSYPHELSGGMQQRVMIAMALACKPQMLIADEPTTALDVTIQAQILKLMRDLQKETGTSILLITHNLGVVAETCDRVGVMYAGVMAEIGTVQQIFKEPVHPYTQGLINSIPKLTSGATRLEAIEGNVPNLVKPPSGCRFHPRCPYAMASCRTDKPSMVEVTPGHFTSCHLYSGVSR